MIGTRNNHTLIITLPGSPKACVENLNALLPVLPHALQLISRNDESTQVQQLHNKMISGFEKQRSGCNCERVEEFKQRPRSSPFEMIPIEKAIEIIKQHCNADRVIEVDVSNSKELIGSVLAEDIRSPVDSPAVDVSFVDGYAVRGTSMINTLITHDCHSTCNEE